MSSKFRFNVIERHFNRCEVRLPKGMSQKAFMAKYKLALDHPESDEAKEIEKMGVSVIDTEINIVGPYPVSSQKQKPKKTDAA